MDFSIKNLTITKYFDSKEIKEDANEENVLVEFFKKYNKLLAYNQDIQENMNKEQIINDVIVILKNISIGNKEQVYFSMLVFINNLMVDCVDSSYYKNVYFKLLLIDDFSYVKNIIFDNINSLKIQKVTLSLIYLLFFTSNDNILLLTIDHFEFLFNILSKIKIIGSCNTSNDISDWIHIIINYIHQSTEDYSFLNKNSKETFLFNILFDELSFKNKVILLEYLRDVLELQKDAKELVLYEHISIKIFEIILITIKECEEKVKLMKNDKIIDIFYAIENDYTDETIIIFKKLLLLSDIFAVIITYDEVIKDIISSYNTKIKNVMHDTYNIEVLTSNIILLLQYTDTYYNVNYNNLKGSKDMEASKISINNIFYSFQTNLLKILSNFSYKNNNLKEYFLIKKEEFYYLLNHMKNDNCNPFKREWSILLIKSLTDDCFKIQQMVEELKPCDVDPFVREYLLKKGYDIKIDSGYSKPTVVKKNN